MSRSANSSPGVTLGFTNSSRCFGQRVRLLEEDRFAHLYLLGRTGVGKSHLLKSLIWQDLQAGNGLLVLDPHGDLTRELTQEAKAGTSRLRSFSAVAAGLHINPLSLQNGVGVDLTVAMVLSVFQKLWEENWGPRLEHLLRNTLYLLILNEGQTLGNIAQILVDKRMREGLLHKISDRAVRTYWEDEFAGYSPAFRAVVTAPLQNKLGALLTNRYLRSILDTTETTLDLTRALRDSEAIVVDLAKGQIGEDSANLLGGLITAQVTLAGLARAKDQQEARPAFFAYLDEFPGYTTSLLATGLSELRKYRLGLVLAHQYLGQLEPFVRDAVLGNVGTTLCFRLGAPDAAMIAREFDPVFKPSDLLNLPNYHLATKLLIEGQVSRPFSMSTYPTLLPE